MGTLAEILASIASIFGSIFGIAKATESKSQKNKSVEELLPQTSNSEKVADDLSGGHK